MAAILDEVKTVLHRIRARLYPNYLSTVDGAFIARTDDEASLKVSQVIAAMRDRGGFQGSAADAENCVNAYLKESMYQLCDGFSVDFHYFRLYPRIAGAFKDATEHWDAAKHPIKFGFHVQKPLRDIVPYIEVLIEGVNDSSGYIADFTDVTTEAVNESATPGGIFVLEGHRIKLAGTHADCGVYFVPAAGNPAPREKVSGNLAENTASKIIGAIPNLPAGKWRVQIVSQFSGSGTLLKTPREIGFKTDITVA